MNKKELGTLIIDGTDDFYRVAKVDSQRRCGLTGCCSGSSE